jgi:glyoxylase-like metal-dependent hydrolase (beta-lactamase superfamily II)
VSVVEIIPKIQKELNPFMFMGENLIKSFLFTVVIFSIIFVIYGDELSFGLDDPVVDQINPEKNNTHHFPVNGICAPGFASLGEICVLNDRCGPGVYAGKVCFIDGKIQPYLRPIHQGHAGLSVDNIICAEGKQLVFKSHDATPACFGSDSIEKIKLRGWQTTKPLVACTLEYAPVCGMDGKTYGNKCALKAEHMILKHQGECSEKSFITNFEECVDAGNPVMESYPRQCRTEVGKNFTEIIDIPQKTNTTFSNLYVDSKLVDCVGVAPQQCMLVREDADSDWEYFYDQISGFKFEKGYEYKLKIKTTEIKNPPADASSLKYTLIKVLEKNNVENPMQVSDGVFPETILYTKQPSVIVSDKGYFVDEIADGVFWLIGGGYQVMFLVTGEGVIVIDAPQPLGEKYLEAISDVTDEPITHMIYSHSHADHTGSAGQIFPDNIEFIAHQDTADILILENDPNRPIPTITFDDVYILSVGNQLLELHYIGPFHSEGDIVIYSPEHKIAMAVDLFHPEAAPYKGFGVTIDLNEHLKAHDTLVDNFDFEVLVSGHEEILGTKEHIKTDKEFVLSVMDNTQKAMTSVSDDKVISTCVDMTTKQWQGKLADLDRFMVEHCTAMKAHLLSEKEV